MITTSLAVLDAEQFDAKLVSLADAERARLVDFLRELGLFDERKLYAELGHSSLFAYCMDGLRLSNGSAYRRMMGARLLRRFPVIGDFIADGRLNLARVTLLKDVLTKENHVEILERATRGTEDDVKVLVASLRPGPAVQDSIRKLPTRREEVGAATLGAPVLTLEIRGDESARTTERDSGLAPPTPATAANAPNCAAPQVSDGRKEMGRAEHEPSMRPRPSRMEVQPSSGSEYAVRLSVSRAFVEEFEQVKAALSHKVPDGHFEDVLRECFRITLEAVERRRAGAPRKPTKAPAPVPSTEENAKKLEPEGRESEACGTRAPPPKKRSRYIPAAVRRAVWDRDGGACAFVSADGRRCGSKHQIEFHHLETFATGGASTIENLSLRCRLCRMRHKRHYAASLLMPRVGGGPTRTSANSRHNQSASRNARRRSVGRYLSLPTSGGAVLASARSFIFRSASRYICVVSTLSWPSQSAMTARSTPDWSRCTAVVWRST